MRRYQPISQALTVAVLSADYAGVRPKLSAPNEAASDFLIQCVATYGIVGMINLMGIESPSLSSSLAIDCGEVHSNIDDKRST
jgi:L-2-hydroxyglutarate oxidase LhgO